MASNASLKSWGAFRQGQKTGGSWTLLESKCCVNVGYLKKKGFNVPEKWYEQKKPLPYTENKFFKILWDFNIQTDNIIEYKRKTRHDYHR